MLMKMNKMICLGISQCAGHRAADHEPPIHEIKEDVDRKFRFEPEVKCASKVLCTAAKLAADQGPCKAACESA
jgi:hypothetical protein